MRNTMTIFSRELMSYFNSAIAYIFVIVFLLFTAGFYMTTFFLSGAADMRGFFANLPIFLLFFLPAVTMRLWAEERRLGTLELLMTLPMKAWQVVLGKYFAAFIFYALALAGTLTIPIMLASLGNPDLGAIFASYLGSLLLGGFYLAVGSFVSSLFKDQIAAFVVAFVICVFFYFVGDPTWAAVIDGWRSGLGSFLQAHVGLQEHFSGIQRGVIDLRNLLYFLLMSGLFLILNTLSLEGRRF